MVYATDLKSVGSNLMRVQVPPTALIKKIEKVLIIYLFFVNLVILKIDINLCAKAGLPAEAKRRRVSYSGYYITLPR